ncbi:MAG TPA: DNA primase [Candidatus Aphodomonas merdavium]|nr:DNA primase [Candidatus Aphodomonas merdavium]
MVSYPREMAGLRQWICWRLEPDPKSDKPRKVPYDPKTGRKASSTNPQTWATLDEAMDARTKYLFTGVGFVFTEAGGIVGVDIDHCRNEDGTFTETAQAILDKYPSYTEISPSGAGLHIFYRGEMPGKGNKNSTTGVEMYASARYFTMTGNRLEGTPEAIADGAQALLWIHENYIAKKKAGRKAKVKKAARTVALTDEQVLEKAAASQNGEEFTALWEGRWDGKFGSQSEADLSLCCSLAFWTGKNKEQMDRLFRQSKLFREKWDKVHHADGATYGEETLEQAIQRTEQVYSPGGELGLYEANGRYYRERGENVYALTNFVVHPLEMIVAEDETQMTCDAVTMYGETFRLTFMTSDFASAQKFKAVLNRRTISLSYMGSDGDLEILKSYLAGLEWQVRYGVKALGLHERDGRWVFVDKQKSVMAGGEIVPDMVQLEKYASIATELPGHASITQAQLADIGQTLLDYNEAAKTVTVLAWSAGCFVKEILRSLDIKYPHLFLIGEAGSGKSTTMERVILPLFGRKKVIAAPQITAFTLLKDAASSNLFPQVLDEFKPSKIDRVRLPILYNHFRDSYDGHEGVRGRADQSQVSYMLLAPLAVAGEESPDEPSVRERILELLFSKKDLKNPASRLAIGKLSMNKDTLTALGRGLLDTVLTVNTATVKQWFEESASMFRTTLPSRVVNNLTCCMTGLKLLEALCNRLGLAWGQVFSISMDACAKYLDYGVTHYLLDGGDTNKSVIELSLEVIDRMGLTNDECRMLEDGNIAIHFRSAYDRFTQYRRDHAITGECLAYAQFMKQLRKSDLYIEDRTVRFGDNPKKGIILNYPLIRQRCDVEGFLQSQIEPLTCNQNTLVTS